MVVLCLSASVFQLNELRKPILSSNNNNHVTPYKTKRTRKRVYARNVSLGIVCFYFILAYYFVRYCFTLNFKLILSGVLIHSCSTLYCSGCESVCVCVCAYACLMLPFETSSKVNLFSLFFGPQFILTL